MPHLRTLILMISLVAPATAVAHKTAYVGHFTTLDRSAPGCGTLFVGSMATFATIGGRKVAVVIPCIEMQKARMLNGHIAPLKRHVLYRILVSSERPGLLSYPRASAHTLYLLEARETATPRLDKTSRLKR